MIASVMTIISHSQNKGSIVLDFDSKKIRFHPYAKPSSSICSYLAVVVNTVISSSYPVLLLWGIAFPVLPEGYSSKNRYENQSQKLIRTSLRAMRKTRKKSTLRALFLSGIKLLLKIFQSGLPLPPFL